MIICSTSTSNTIQDGVMMLGLAVVLKETNEAQEE